MTRARAAGVVLCALWGIAAPGPARAACVIDAVGAVSFGTYDPLSATPLDSSGSVTFRCLLSVLITIDLGPGSSAAYAARTLKSSTNTLVYNLYLDAARLTIWGDAASNGTVHYGPVLGLLSGVTVPIYARVPARQDVAAGSYSDTVVVTLNF